MKAMLVITLSLFLIGVAVSATESAGPCLAHEAATCAAGTTMSTCEDGLLSVSSTLPFSSDVAEAHGGWWNWLKKIVRLLQSVIDIFGPDDGDDPQT